jgi:hypothetical protein
LKKQLSDNAIKPKDVTIAELNVGSRLRGTLFFVDIAGKMPASEFVRLYSQRDVLKFRAMGRKKVHELQETFKEIGYDWY